MSGDIPDRGVVYWPVGSGDSTTVVVDENTIMQIDLRDLGMAQDDDTPEAAVVDRLIESLPTRAGRPYLAAFALTHADKDHCLGFADLLNKATIGELWATPRLWREYDESDGDGLCEDAKAFHKEVRRRVEVIKASVAAGQPVVSGERVLVIGHDRDGDGFDYHGLPRKFITGPGHSVTKIDGVEHVGVFRAFIHAPFIDDCAAERNETSLAMQVTLTDPSGADGKFLVLGDLAHDTIMKIFDYSEAKKREQYLEWDALLAPHHCSKYVMYRRNAGVDEYLGDVMDAFERNGRDAIVVSSSSPIPAVDDAGHNPPHRKAHDRYVEIAEQFVCTMEWPNEQAPVPVTFVVDETGARLLDPSESAELAAKSVSKAASFGRLAAVVAAAGGVAVEVARHRRTGSKPSSGDGVAGTAGIRRATTRDRAGGRAPVRPAGFGR